MWKTDYGSNTECRGTTGVGDTRSSPNLLKKKKKKQKTFFVSHEDAFAHSILESKEIYANNIAKDLPPYEGEITRDEVDDYLNKSWKSLPIPNIIEAFKVISHYASKNGESIVDEKYQKLIKYLIANCGQFTDAEILDVLKSIALWPLLQTRQETNFQSFYSALDKECVRRAHKWTVDELLLFSDHWHKVKLFRYTEFGALVIKKIAMKPSRMTPANLVQYMFYVNSSRRHPGDMYNLEYRMESCVDELDLNEIAILSMGFFKSQTPIRNPNLLIKIIQRVIKDIDTIHEISFATFMKTIRYSTTIHKDSGILWELLVSTIPQISRLSLKALVHILTMTIKTRIFQPELLTLVAQRFNKEIKDARIKDMERLVLALTCFNFTPDIQPNIFQTIVEEIRSEERRPELEKYQKSLANLLQYLSVVNVYPKDLIALIFDPENLKTTYGARAYNLDHPLLVIDLNIDTEVPDYTGPRLDDKSRAIIAKGYLHPISESSDRQLSSRQTFMIEIMDTCKQIFGSTDRVRVDWVLPQYKEADLIICLDKNNSALPIINKLSESPLGNVKRRPEHCPEGSRWLALVIGGYNCYIRDSCNLLGKDCVKIRQLERIGYEPILIPWYEWCVSGLDRKNYLKQKIFK